LSICQKYHQAFCSVLNCFQVPLSEKYSNCQAQT
jgi:hypothetical protein